LQESFKLTRHPHFPHNFVGLEFPPDLREECRGDRLHHDSASEIPARLRRWESSVEGALIEMYVSVRRVVDITGALWGTWVWPSTISDLNKRIYATIEAWRNRPIEGWHP